MVSRFRSPRHYSVSLRCPVPPGIGRHADHGVSMRLIVDFADMDKSLHVLPTGESGYLKSPNYKDQIPLYLNGQYHPAWPNREDAEKNSRDILILSPE